MTKLEKLAIRMAENRQELREAKEASTDMLGRMVGHRFNIEWVSDVELTKAIGDLLYSYDHKNFSEMPEKWTGWIDAYNAHGVENEKLKLFCELKDKQKDLKQEYGRLKTTICAIGRGLKARALKARVQGIFAE